MPRTLSCLRAAPEDGQKPTLWHLTYIIHDHESIIIVYNCHPSSSTLSIYNIYTYKILRQEFLPTLI